MRRHRKLLFGIVLLLILVCVGVAGWFAPYTPAVVALARSGPAIPAAQGGCWMVFTWPATGFATVHWQDLTALPSGEVWLAGEVPFAGIDRAVVDHWDGQQWIREFLSPAADSRFTQVVASTPHNIWVAGTTGTQPTVGVFFHWDGSHWQQLPELPWHLINYHQVSLGASLLAAIIPLPTGGLRVVGTDQTGPHGSNPRNWSVLWDGNQWVEEPDLTGTQLTAVITHGPDDVWAAGETSTLLHWDGTTWQPISPMPTLANAMDLDYNTAAIGSAGDLWIAGNLRRTQPGIPQTVVARWDGSRWQQIAPPLATEIRDLAVLSPGLWAVGIEDSNTGSDHLWAGHWTGRAWESLPLPVHGERSALNRMVVGAAGERWLLGNQNIGADHSTPGESMLLRYTEAACPAAPAR